MVQKGHHPCPTPHRPGGSLGRRSAQPSPRRRPPQQWGSVPRDPRPPSRRGRARPRRETVRAPPGRAPAPGKATRSDRDATRPPRETRSRPRRAARSVRQGPRGRRRRARVGVAGAGAAGEVAAVGARRQVTRQVPPSALACSPPASRSTPAAPLPSLLVRWRPASPSSLRRPAPRPPRSVRLRPEPQPRLRPRPQRRPRLRAQRRPRPPLRLRRRPWPCPAVRRSGTPARLRPVRPQRRPASPAGAAGGAGLATVPRTPWLLQRRWSVGSTAGRSPPRRRGGRRASPRRGLPAGTSCASRYASARRRSRSSKGAS